MTTTITTTPTLGERAIITEYGYRTPATWEDVCAKKQHWHTPHWCYDEPTPAGFTWNTEPRAEREPISAEPEPREWQAGDVVDHPKYGRGLVTRAPSGACVRRVHFTEDRSHYIATVADDLTLVLAAPEPPKPDEPTGLGAVVRDRDGTLWVQVGSDILSWRSREYHGGRRHWDDIDATEVLSEGYTPKKETL